MLYYQTSRGQETKPALASWYLIFLMILVPHLLLSLYSEIIYTFEILWSPAVSDRRKRLNLFLTSKHFLQQWSTRFRPQSEKKNFAKKYLSKKNHAHQSRLLIRFSRSFLPLTVGLDILNWSNNEFRCFPFPLRHTLKHYYFMIDFMVKNLVKM